MGVETRTVGETCPVAGVWPTFHLPMISGGQNWNFNIIISYAFTICSVGLCESMLSLQALDKMTCTIPTDFRSY